MQKYILNNPVSWLLLLASLACTHFKPMLYPELASPDIPAKYSYLALGDSYTIGESVAVADRWTYLLAQNLRQAGIDVANPTTIARTGWTTAELQEAIRESKVNATFDLVTLLIGVNNQYRGQSLETYQTEFRELLQTAIKFAADKPRHVLVLSIPDWGVTPFAEDRDQKKIAQEIDAFNTVAQKECEQLNVTFVDITPTSRKALQNGSYVAPDMLHFSGKMYTEWATLALPLAKTIWE
ncbi:SGNH/GDSL hydrolase family protein [Adhaeribacter swui]|uniref:SGNH/GDSL hydrolase family protein n=1 Tax=Adhaeribacter swui TaxID=2086471 RepID=A0A7G7G8J5_9BACT|nr:SGNH/GDSL hydrolase family protein [Adhaeribacter swui]QNF33479.1 SGNH/GDSL hydrolase family protein [Adhaeribacter swui]